jgi:hypothetical protein
MTEQMKQTRTPLEVTSLLARGAERALQAPAVEFLARGAGLVSVRANAEAPPAQSLVHVLLEGSREPCVVSMRQGQSYYALLTERDRSWITKSGIAVLIPVLSSRGRGELMGVVALKHRKNALAFSPDDLRFLRAATACASLACDAMHSSVSNASPGNAPEEVGIQCKRCGHVDVWSALDQPCECGERRWEPAVLPQQLLGRFEVRRKLGAGGMGVVYRATDLTLGRDVAVKTLTRLSDEAARRLILEARAMAGLSHPHIAVLYGAELWRGTPLLLIEHLAGGTLAMRLHAGPLDTPTAFAIVKSLALALMHVHGSGHYHGDIKPSNIGFTADGVPKFLDFGLSRAIAEPIAESTDPPSPSRHRPLMAGTPAYMSPEVRDGAAPGPELDVWALNLVLCESLTGTLPASNVETPGEILRRAGAAVQSLPVSTTGALRRFLGGALAELPMRHPQTASALLRELSQIDVDAP